MALKDFHFTKDSFNSKYFGEGTYEVILTEVDAGITAGGSDYLEITYKGKNGELSQKSRMWMTPKSYEYTARTVKSLAVHNAIDEAHKQKMHEYFDENVKDGEDLLNVLIGLVNRGNAEAWITRTRQDEPYDVREDGTPKYGYNVNFYAYNPDKKKEDTGKDGKKKALEILGDADPVDMKETPFD